MLGNVLCGAQPHLERFSFDNNRRIAIVVCVCVCRYRSGYRGVLYRVCVCVCFSDSFAALPTEFHNLDSSSWPLKAGAGDTEPEPDADADAEPDADAEADAEPDGVPEPEAVSKRFASASFAACSSTKISMRLLMPIK